MLWGVAAALLANVLFSAGFVIEKRALSSLPPLSAARPGQVVAHLLRSPLWLLGAISLLLGFAAQLAVYRTLPLVAAQGLFVTGLVMLLLLSALFLGERSTGRERQAMVAIVAALVMIVFSLHESTEKISKLAPLPVLLAICLPSLALALGLFLSAERRSRRRHRLPTAGVPYGVAVGFLYGVSSLAIKGAAGLIDVADVPGTAIAMLTSPYPYILLFTGSTGLILSQTALQRCRASLIVPVCTTVNFLFAVVSGTIAFAEPLPGEPLRLALRLGGAALAVSVLLALPRHDEPAPEPGAEPEPESDTPPSPDPGTTGTEAEAGTEARTGTGTSTADAPTPHHPEPRKGSGHHVHPLP
ncbi:DMT family transporter [Streptomyces sp. NPDC054796]